MPAPYVTGQEPEQILPDLDHTIDTARALDRHLAAAIADFAPTKGQTMTTQGSFSASLKAMVEEARAGVEQARTEGQKLVGDAITELKQATAATTRVAGTTAQAIKDEAAAVMSDLGQISNDI